MYYARLGFLLLSVTFINNAMKKEDEKKLDILAEIPAKRGPLDVYHITDDSFVVQTLSFKCNIIDWRSYTSKVLDDSFVCYVRVNTKNKKIILSRRDVVKIYDENGKEERSLTEKGYIRACEFDLSHNFLFICSNPDLVGGGNFTVACQNYYHNGRYERIYNHPFYSPVDFNPCKEEMAMLHGQSVFLYTLSGISSASKRIELPYECNFCKYSPHGACIIAGNTAHIFKIDLTKEEVSALLHWDNQAEFKKILFYSKNVLVTIAKIFSWKKKSTYIVNYWDINTKELIYQMPSFESSDYALSVSPHKKNIVIAVDDKYMVVPIHFEVMYESDIKKDFPFLLLTFNHLQTQHQVPQDIVGYCKDILLELFER